MWEGSGGEEDLEQDVHRVTWQAEIGRGMNAGDHRCYTLRDL